MSWNRPNEDYYAARVEPNSCPDSSLSDSEEEPELSNLCEAVQRLPGCAKAAGFAVAQLPGLFKPVKDDADFFRVGFSSRPRTRILALQTPLSKESQLCEARFHNYSGVRRHYVTSLTDKLVCHNPA